MIYILLLVTQQGLLMSRISVQTPSPFFPGCSKEQQAMWHRLQQKRKSRGHFEKIEVPSICTRVHLD